MTPSKKWYLLALLLFLAGPLLGLYILITSIYHASKHGITFYVPGVSQIYVTQKGNYTLWMENQRPQASNQVASDLKKITFTITDPVTSKQTILVPKIGWTSHDKNIEHFSLGTINFDHTGPYKINATSPEYSPYKVYLRKPGLPAIIRALALAFLTTLLGIISGVLLAIIILTKRMSERTKMTEQTSPKPELPKPEATAEGVTKDATTWAMVCHLSGFAGFMFPFANIIAPLLIWGFKRSQYPYLDDQGKEAINFQISVTIYYIISAMLILIIVGLFLLPLLAAFHIIAMIIASVETAQGRPFRYPLTIRFIK